MAGETGEVCYFPRASVGATYEKERASCSFFKLNIYFEDEREAHLECLSRMSGILIVRLG